MVHVVRPSVGMAVFMTVFIASLLAAYITYELLVHSHIMYARNELESHLVYGDYVTEHVYVYSTGWWYLHSHHLFFASTVLFVVAYVLSEAIQCGGGTAAVAACFNLGAFVVYLLALIWWFTHCAPKHDRCSVLRETASSSLVNDTTKLGVPLFYLALSVVSFFFFTLFPVYMCFANDKSKRRRVKQASNMSESLLNQTAQAVLSATPLVVERPRTFFTRSKNA